MQVKACLKTREFGGTLYACNNNLVGDQICNLGYDRD